MTLPGRGSPRPVQDINVFGLQKRTSTRHKSPWIARWSIDGQHRSRSFRTKSEAERYRSLLVHARHQGEHFDEHTGEPASWLPNPDDVAMNTWARRWVAEQWSEWQPRTRASAVEALARFVPLVVTSLAAKQPVGLRSYLVQTLPPDGQQGIEADGVLEQWLDRYCLTLGQLNREVLAEAEGKLALRDDGQQLAASTASRYRKTARACVRRAVELEVLDADPWPPAPRGRAQRRSTRARRELRALPDPDTMTKAIDAIRSHQPASRTYQVMTAVAYYGGLRPSEVVMLRRSAVALPESGWGRLEVREADVAFDEPGEPKTGPRSVPIPQPLVEILRGWIDEGGFAPDDLLFRTRTGRRPTASNWARAWQRALRQVGAPPLRVYDCRHAAATTWIQAGVPLGEAARRLGHSVETLVSTYVGALAGDESLANARIDEVLTRTTSRPATMRDVGDPAARRARTRRTRPSR
jgi:integrase